MSICLYNHRLSVQIEAVGAQLCSVRSRDGTEYIWQADPAIWNRHSPLLFPVIGRLRGGQYTLHGRAHSIGPHGFARDALFTVVSQCDTSVSLVLIHSPETLAMWPFPFSLTVTYTLEENKLTKACTVANPSEDIMYYELGSHDGFRAPLAPGETMEDYAIVLPGVDVLTPYGLDENVMITPKGELSFPLAKGRISLKPYDYGLDTIILDQLPQPTAQLVDRQGRARVTLDFADYPYLGIWTQQKDFDTNYVCIEPWSSLPDAVFAGRDLSQKAGIRHLAPRQQEMLSYTTTFT